MPITAMFPLSSVLTPGAAVSLRVFEPRYRQLLTDCLADNGTFGIVLIERGHEVGGGDTRFDVGTLAHIEEHRDLGDGQHGVGVVGLRRIRIDAWLDDAPYPRAQTSGWADEPESDPTETQRAYVDGVAQLRRFLAFAAELGHAVPPATFDAPDDPVTGSHLLSALAPIGPLDRQHLLETRGPLTRLSLLSELIADQADLLSVR